MQGLESARSYFPEIERVSVGSVDPLQLSEWYWLAIAATFTAQLAASRDQYDDKRGAIVISHDYSLPLPLIVRSH